MLVLRILRFDADHAWVGWPEYYRADLEWRLAWLTDLDKSSIKRLARQIRDRVCSDIPLRQTVDQYEAETLRFFLEGVGAETMLVAETEDAPDRGGE